MKERQWLAQLEFKLQDFWIGFFWKTLGSRADLWICLIPCIPLHICWWSAAIDENRVFQDDGSWFFWDETWVYFLGPYYSYESAVESLYSYQPSINHNLSRVIT